MFTGIIEELGEVGSDPNAGGGRAACDPLPRRA